MYHLLAFVEKFSYLIISLLFLWLVDLLIVVFHVKGVGIFGIDFLKLFIILIVSVFSIWKVRPLTQFLALNW